MTHDELRTALWDLIAVVQKLTREQFAKVPKTPSEDRNGAAWAEYRRLSGLTQALVEAAESFR